jgi:hypothetical protein
MVRNSGYKGYGRFVVRDATRDYIRAIAARSATIYQKYQT